MEAVWLATAWLMFCLGVMAAMVVVTAITDKLIAIVLELRNLNCILCELMDDDEDDEFDNECDPADDWKKRVPES